MGDNCARQVGDTESKQQTCSRVDHSHNINTCEDRHVNQRVDSPSDVQVSSLVKQQNVALEPQGASHVEQPDQKIITPERQSCRDSHSMSSGYRNPTPKICFSNYFSSYAC